MKGLGRSRISERKKSNCNVPQPAIQRALEGVSLLVEKAEPVYHLTQSLEAGSLGVGLPLSKVVFAAEADLEVAES